MCGRDPLRNVSLSPISHRGSGEQDTIKQVQVKYTVLFTNVKEEMQCLPRGVSLLVGAELYPSGHGGEDDVVLAQCSEGKKGRREAEGDSPCSSFSQVFLGVRLPVE